MIKNISGILLIYVWVATVFAQEKDHISIHRLEQTFYSKNNEVTGPPENFISPIQTNGPLQKRVFGYHPYWAGYDYLNYQWDLLSDLCYFSYELDPVTGNPTDIHEWDTSPAIDSALANGVKVHLCVTIFSGHTTFFENPIAQATLIENIISLIQTRGAHGVNMDVEALPATQSENFMDFMVALCTEIDNSLPEAEVSIAAPAVNWSNKFNIPLLNEYIDFFMVMAYDYYWPGSTQAGPVSPLYSMTEYYDYNFSKTISYYQSQGVSPERIVMGVPYYAYNWPTEGPIAPSATLANAIASTYSAIRTNTLGYYTPENKKFEENSLSPYYSYHNGDWRQCFIDDVHGMRRKFNIVNHRDLSGIGIWALGYDDGYDDFWNLINEKFTTGGDIVPADTIYDTGGPAFGYYNNENYCYKLKTIPGSHIFLSFSYLNLEEGYDTLWIYDGGDTSAPLLHFFTGDTVPFSVISSGNTLTLRFLSDAATTEAGWRAVYDTLPVSGVNPAHFPFRVNIYPNPVLNSLFIAADVNTHNHQKITCNIFDLSGRMLSQKILADDRVHTIDMSGFPAGFYMLYLYINDQQFAVYKIVKK